MRAAYALDLDHPGILRAILAGIVETGDVIGRDRSARRTVLAIAVDDWLLDELAAIDAGAEDREDDDPAEDAFA